jgi:hypothetical protein
MQKFSLGDRVKVKNGTIQENQFGKVLKADPKSEFIIVELESGLRWPVYEHEIEKASEETQAS